MKPIDSSSHNCAPFSQPTEAEQRISAYRNSPDKRELDLSGLGLTEVPPEVFTFRDLESLNLSDNALEAFPAGLQDLDSLTHLNVRNNQLTNIPYWIKDYKRLKMAGNSFPKGMKSLYQKYRISLDRLNLSARGEHQLLNGRFQRAEVIKALIKYATTPGSKKLDLNCLELTEVPPEVCKLHDLERLSLQYNNLRSLPAEFKDLKKLKHLRLNSNEHLDFPPCITALEKLLLLDLSATATTEIPEGIKFLKKLTSLVIGYNNIFHLPDEIGTLSHLRILKVNRCPHLQNLPDTIGTLTNLNFLDFSSTSLEELPDGLFKLPSTCRVLADDIPYDINELIEDEENDPDYEGPQFLIHSGSHWRKEQPLTRQIRLELQHLGCDFDTSQLTADPKNTQSLTDWLKGLKNISGIYKNEAIKDFFISNILTYIQEANDNPEFREKFFIRLDKAAITCGDRMALSAIHLGLDYELLKLDLHDLHSAALFLGRGAWAVQMLEDTSRETAQRLKDADPAFKEELEVHLAYLIQLKDELHLPLNQNKMLFFEESNVTEGDLAAAKALVLNHLNNKDAYARFLVGHDTWMEALRLNYPARMANIEAQRDAFIDREDYDGYTRRLIDLTDEALSGPSLLEQERALRAEQDAEYEAALALDRRRETLHSLGEELSRATEELAGLRGHIAPFKTCCEAFNTLISRKGPAALRGSDVQGLLERLERQVAGVELVIPTEDAFKERVAEFDELNGAYQTYCAALERVQYPQHWNLLKKQFSELGGEQLLKTLRNDEQRPFWDILKREEG